MTNGARIVFSSVLILICAAGFAGEERLTSIKRDEPFGSALPHRDRAISHPHKPIPDWTRQLLTVVSAQWDSPTALLQRYERVNETWRKVGTAWPVVLGARGMKWGRGTHAVEASETRMKKEGDNATPAGAYPVGAAYGSSDTPPPGATWPYKETTRSWVCVDDPASHFYNRVFDEQEQPKKDWTSAERMRRDDALYNWVINIDQNRDAEKAGGSCIFFHVWRNDQSPTEGCTAMSESNMIALLTWLKPEATPYVVQLPEHEYRRRRRAWGLP